MNSMDYLKDITTKMENAKIMLLHIFSLHVVGTFSRALMIQNTEPIFSWLWDQNTKNISCFSIRKKFPEKLTWEMTSFL